jgi:hypothetical protein
MAVVNAVGVSVFFVVYFVGFSRLSPLFKRSWLSLAIGVAFAVIAWGIRRMSRAAALLSVPAPRLAADYGVATDAGGDSCGIAISFILTTGSF